ncbi:hypothetical protein [Streptomyces sp. NPDC004324]
MTDTADGTGNLFDGTPRSLLKAVGNNPGFIAAIRKGLAALGEG